MEMFKLVGTIMVDAAEAIKSISKTGDEAEGTASKLGNGVKTAAKWAAGVTTAAVAVGGAMIAAAKDTATNLDEIDKMSERLGLTRQAYQELDYVLSQSGVDINSFQTGAKSLLAAMDKVSEGNATATANFEKLGVSVQNADGSLRSQEDVLFDTIRAFQAMDDSAEKSRLAQELFGKQGQEILPLLNAEAGSMDELRAAANELGLVMSDEAIDAGVEFTDTMDTVQRSLGTLKDSLVTELMPYVVQILQWVVDNIPVIKETIQTVMDAVLPIIKPVLDFIMAVLPKLLALFTKVVHALMPVLEPVIDAISSLFEGLFALLEGDTEGFAEAFKNVFKSLATAMFTLGKLIFTSLWDGLKYIWEQISGWISEKLGGLMDTFGKIGSTVSGWFSHAGGVAYVPYDNYPAMLHKGETVLNASNTNDLVSAIKDLKQNGTGDSGPITIVVKSVLDGKQIGESVTTYQRGRSRAYGI